MEDEINHDLFKEIAEKIYRETGVMIRYVSLDWSGPGFGPETSCVLEVKIDSVKLQ